MIAIPIIMMMALYANNVVINVLNVLEVQQLVTVVQMPIDQDQPVNVTPHFMMMESMQHVSLVYTLVKLVQMLPHVKLVLLLH